MSLPDFAPVILVAPSMAALRTAFGKRKRDDGSDEIDENGAVPDVPGYHRSATPPIWKMKDGTPYVEDGATITPRVRDLTSTKLAFVVVLDTDEALALKAKFPTNVFAYRPVGLANAQAAHHELEWSALGEVWGWKPV